MCGGGVVGVVGVVDVVDVVDVVVVVHGVEVGGGDSGEGCCEAVCLC